MNQFLFEFFPVLLFFLAFKIYGIYVATVVGMVSSAIQVLGVRAVKKIWDKKQLITLAVFVIFGSMTLYFHNPIFIKWKPSIVLWIFAGVLAVSALFQRVSLLERMLENALADDKASLTSTDWLILNIMWCLFLFILGCINVWVAYFTSDNAWVNFKFYGITGALIGFSIVQAFYLAFKLNHSKKTHIS